MILTTVIIGTFLGRLDQTIVGLALPKIIIDFAITVTAAGWISTAYILANSIFVPVWGKLGDTVGRKKIYILGFSIFIFGSALAGFSWNLGSMIVFRIIQAIAASADYPTAMAIIAVTFEQGRERAQALGIWTSSFAAAAVFGPIIGGPLIDLFGWRSIFLVNIPIGIIGILMALSYVHESVSDRPTFKFDIWGAVTLGGALSTLTLVLDQGNTWGWFSLDSLLCYAGSILFGTIFYFIEKNHEDPIVDFKFFQDSIFVNVLGNNFIVFMGMFGGIFLIPIFAQTFLGYTATESGFLLMPMAAGIMLASPIGGMFVGRIQPKYVIFASTIVAGISIYFLSHLDPRSGPFAIMIPMFFMALGMGFGMPQRTGIIASIVPTAEIGIASSVLALVRNIAGAFGIAIFSAILNTTEGANILQFARNAVVNTTDPNVLKEVTSLIILRAQISSYDYVFVVASIVIIVGAFTVLFMKPIVEQKGTSVMVE